MEMETLRAILAEQMFLSRYSQGGITFDISENMTVRERTTLLTMAKEAIDEEKQAAASATPKTPVAHTRPSRTSRR